MAQATFETPDISRIPPPWDYNPSRWSQRIPICILASVAAVIAGYMALYQWRLIPTVWDPVFGDQSARVLDSDVSHEMRRWMIIPDAALGALAYLGDALFGLAGSTRRWQCRPWLVILFGIDVIPLGIVGVVAGPRKSRSQSRRPITMQTPDGPAFFCAPAYTRPMLRMSNGCDRKSLDMSHTMGADTSGTW